MGKEFISLELKITMKTTFLILALTLLFVPYGTPMALHYRQLKPVEGFEDFDDQETTSWMEDFQDFWEPLFNWNTRVISQPEYIQLTDQICRLPNSKICNYRIM